ncbi:class I SAM-dependent methyltransferase [Janthinobacterium sp. GW458P]|uniref:class I SAM-dependent methyltransferase n=1 Tax=Janthinobacterium sp. GW458P TaxID=1981504 RepID=UPI000A322BE7|nr:class I SAM-dependent methyltransferase [Janthinobacterium sp. GW458P]MBE3024035.1 class I SAM-dependent methyltransferase [Janthinobacterium sp. GW458P]
MSNWNNGYMAEIAYTYGYYEELNPLRLRLPLLAAGLALPGSGTACELGFGQGVSANIHAAASATRWYGNDFNPAQAAFAQELASAAGAGAHFTDESFAQFCRREDLPDFDFICLHGIWSWVSAENRALIVDFLQRKLKVGGVAFISYNTQPGWAAMMPMRDLLAEHSRVMGAPGQGVLARIDGALDFVDRMIATQPRYLKANPLLADRFEKLKAMDRNYLAHEYFNADWQPMAFSRVAAMLSEAKLEFAASATYTDLVDMLNMTAGHQQFLADIPDPILRETTRAFLVNQQFRKDYWVKGARTLTPFAQATALRAVRVMLAVPRDEVVLSVHGVLGDADMDARVYAPVLDAMADHRVCTIGELEQQLAGTDANLAALLQIMLILISKGSVLAVQDAADIAVARPQTARLNAHLLEQALARTDLSSLASPMTGSGVFVSHLQQLFLWAKMQGWQVPQEWVRETWPVLIRLNQLLTRDGQPLLTEEENLAELLQHARHFAARTMPVLRALGVTD